MRNSMSAKQETRIVPKLNFLIGGQPVGREVRFISPSNLVTYFEMASAESRVGTS